MRYENKIEVRRKRRQCRN